MIISLTLLLVGQIAPNAVDGYRANFNSLKVEADYEYKSAPVSWSYSQSAFDRAKAGSEFVTSPTFLVNGVWGCDGKTERFFIPIRTKDDSNSLQTQAPYELLFDQKTLAYILTSENHPAIQVTRTNESPLNLFGPFQWWQTSFTQIMDTEFAGSKLNTNNKTYKNVPFKYVSMSKSVTNGSSTLETFFDPSWNFVPKYTRITSLDTKSDMIMIKDCLIFDIAQSKSGGFFPKEYLERSFTVRKFSSKYPPTSPTLEVRGEGNVSLGHFKISKFADMLSPVALHPDPKVPLIGGLGGSVKARIPNPTLNDLLKQLGSKVDRERSIPPIKSSERSGASSANHSVAFASVFSVISISALIAFVRRQKIARNSLGLLLCFAFTLGCNKTDQSYPRVVAKFSSDSITFEPAVKQFDEIVNLFNESNQPVKIFDVSGGCSCRAIDRTAFPFTLAPHQGKNVPIRLQRKNDYLEQSITFQMNTDKGNMISNTNLTFIPSMKIIPEDISLNFNDFVAENSDKESFEIVVRTLTETGKTSKPKLISTPNLATSQVPSKIDKGHLPWDEKIKFTDCTYQVSVLDKTFGLKKGTLSLVNDFNSTLTQSSVVWQRRSLLTSYPSKIFLSNHAVRVFLHSSDDLITFVRISNTPEGVDASFVSPHEIIVKKASHAQISKNGKISIATNSTDHPLLHIDLVFSEDL